MHIRILMASLVTLVALLASVACKPEREPERAPPPPLPKPLPGPMATPEGAKSILLITIDTLRADHLETYGYPRNTSPHMAALARKGIVFENAMSQAPWTLPALASMLTSLYPSQHGVLTNASILAPAVWTIAEALRNVGYRTAAVTSHVWASPRAGMGQGFSRFEEIDFDSVGQASSEKITDMAIAQLKALASEPDPVQADRPFLLWVHYFDPHVTYIRHSEYRFADGYPGPLGAKVPVDLLYRRQRDGRLSQVDIAYIESVYDEEIAFTDAHLGRLLVKAKTLGLADRVVVALTSDHGEAFMEHGRLQHGRDVYDEVVRVPLILGGAIPEELRGTRVAVPVETAWLPSTFMELAGVDEHSFRGPGLLRGRATPLEPGWVISEGSYAWGADERSIAALHESWKLIYRLDDDDYELYNRTSDPAEKIDRYADPNEEAKRVRELLERVIEEHLARGVAMAPTVEIDGTQREHLRALGYAE